MTAKVQKQMQAIQYFVLLSKQFFKETNHWQNETWYNKNEWKGVKIMAKIGLSKPYAAIYSNTGSSVTL